MDNNEWSREYNEHHTYSEKKISINKYSCSNIIHYHQQVPDQKDTIPSYSSRVQAYAPK